MFPYFFLILFPKRRDSRKQWRAGIIKYQSFINISHVGTLLTAAITAIPAVLKQLVQQHAPTVANPVMRGTDPIADAFDLEPIASIKATAEPNPTPADISIISMVGTNGKTITSL